MTYLLYSLETDGSNEDSSPLHGMIVGHDAMSCQESNNIELRVLILLDDEEADAPPKKQHSFWAKINDDASCVQCVDSGASYRLEPQEYHPSSPAYQACESVLTYLKSQVKVVPFLEPVDPIQLGIPDYFDVIKNPMDISTIEKKLADGKYGRLIPNGEYSSSTCRMLFGPFFDDLMLMFDNAMLYNPKGDWIHNDAKNLKALVSRKIQTIGMKAEREAGFDSNGGRSRTRNQSVYVEVDSDEDMYEYESDYDDDLNYDGNKRGKRKRGKSKNTKVEDFATRAIETPVRVPKNMDSVIFSRLPITTEATLFGLPGEWSCRQKQIEIEVNDDEDTIEDDADKERESEELQELIMLQLQLGQQHQTTRRSARSQTQSRNASSEREESGKIDVGKALDKVEYFINDKMLTNLLDSKEIQHVASDRATIETVREKIHEEFYAKLYYDYCSNNATKSMFLESKSEDAYGVFTEGYFPPYLGRIVPSCEQLPVDNDVRWEIRPQYVLPALRWILRGLVQSGHIVEWEPSSLENVDVEASVMTNHIYYKNNSKTPYEVLDVKEMQRRKRIETMNEKEEEEEATETVEMSAYERMRAERVARNKERLKALGLA